MFWGCIRGLAQYIEGYLLEDLASMAKIDLAPGKRYGAVGYPLQPMPSLRLIAWNCNHGSLAERALLLQPLKPDIVFLQECRPS